MAAHYIWSTWTCSTSASSTDSTWIDWCDDTTAVTGNTWVRWVSVAAVTSDDDTTWVNWASDSSTDYYPRADQRTPEQRAADEARWAAERAEIQRKADAAAAARRTAIEKARALLISMLTVQQREQYQRERFFEVIGEHSRRRYRIRQGTHGNVRLIAEDGREVTSYCAQPRGVPDEDAMLAQKLALEHEEQAFLRVANARAM